LHRERRGEQRNNKKQRPAWLRARIPLARPRREREEGRRRRRAGGGARPAEVLMCGDGRGLGRKDACGADGGRGMRVFFGGTTETKTNQKKHWCLWWWWVKIKLGCFSGGGGGWLGGGSSTFRVFGGRGGGAEKGKNQSAAAWAGGRGRRTLVPVSRPRSLVRERLRRRPGPPLCRTTRAVRPRGTTLAFASAGTSRRVLPARTSQGAREVAAALVPRHAPPAPAGALRRRPAAATRTRLGTTRAPLAAGRPGSRRRRRPAKPPWSWRRRQRFGGGREERHGLGKGERKKTLSRPNARPKLTDKNGDGACSKGGERRRGAGVSRCQKR
jgi:hypothetical protein